MYRSVHIIFALSNIIYYSKEGEQFHRYCKGGFNIINKSKPNCTIVRLTAQAWLTPFNDQRRIYAEVNQQSLGTDKALRCRVTRYEQNRHYPIGWRAVSDVFDRI